jgi:ribokinase
MKMGPRLRSSKSNTGRAVIAVVGGAIMDLVYETTRMPDVDESLDALSLAYKPGGKGSNTAIAIYRGCHNKTTPETGVAAPAAQENGFSTGDMDKKEPEIKVYLNTAIGNDQFGTTLKKNLETNGIDTSGIRQHSNDQTGTCAVFVEKYSGNSRDIGYPGANTNWQPKYQDPVECLAGGNKPDLIITHLEKKRETVEAVLNTASKNGVETLLNPSPVYYLLAPIYKTVTHLLINKKEAAELAGIPEKELESEEKLLEACENFMEQGAKHVVITLGAKGTFYATEGDHGMVPAVKNVKVKDATGAG